MTYYVDPPEMSEEGYNVLREHLDAILLSENPFRDYRELFLKANAARRMYRFVAYVLGFICIALVALALCMVATNVLVGGLVW